MSSCHHVIVACHHVIISSLFFNYIFNFLVSQSPDTPYVPFVPIDFSNIVPPSLYPSLPPFPFVSPFLSIPYIPTSSPDSFSSPLIMSDQSDEDLIESQISKKGTNISAEARKIAVEISDDDSDDNAQNGSMPPPHSTAAPPCSPTPPPDHLDEPSHASPPRRPSRPLDSYQRSVATTRSVTNPVDIMHFPPSISFTPTLSQRLNNIPPEPLPILYRVRPEVLGNAKSADLLVQKLRENPHPIALGDILESNANLITWSDGSKTLAIGDQQCEVIEDNVASKHLLFRRGDKIQTCEAHVNKVVRVQPSSTNDARAKQTMNTAIERAANRRGGGGRTMLRCMDDSAEKQETQARVENHRRERERARLEARQRQAKERYAKPNRGLSAEVLESNDEDSGDDRGRRASEQADRLMRVKRPQASSRNAEISVKRRKVGARRVVGSDDESESE